MLEWPLSSHLTLIFRSSRGSFVGKLRKLDGQVSTHNNWCTVSVGEVKTHISCGTPVLASWGLTGSCLPSVKKSHIHPLTEGAIYSGNTWLWSSSRTIVYRWSPKVGFKQETRSKNYRACVNFFLTKVKESKNIKQKSEIETLHNKNKNVFWRKCSNCYTHCLCFFNPNVKSFFKFHGLPYFTNRKQHHEWRWWKSIGFELILMIEKHISFLYV